MPILNGYGGEKAFRQAEAQRRILERKYHSGLQQILHHLIGILKTRKTPETVISAVEDYGAGAVEPGDLIIKLATAGNVNVINGGSVSAATMAGGQLEAYDSVDKTGIVHASIGKVSFSAEKIAENAREFIATIIKLKPAAAKGTYVKSIYLSSTMSLGIKVDPKAVEEI